VTFSIGIRSSSRRNQSTVGDDDTTFDLHAVQSPSDDRRADQLLAHSFTGLGESAAATALAIGSRDDESDVVTGVDERAKRRHDASECRGTRDAPITSSKCNPSDQWRDFKIALTQNLFASRR